MHLYHVLPIALNGLGVSEGVFTLLFSAVGIPTADALAVALLMQISGMLMASLGGLIYLREQRRSHKSSASP